MKVYLLKFPTEKIWNTFKNTMSKQDKETNRVYVTAGINVVEISVIGDIVGSTPETMVLVPHEGYHVNILVDDDKFEMSKELLEYAVLPKTPRYAYGGCEDVPLDTADKEFTEEQKTYMRVEERKAVIQAAKDLEKSNGFVKATR